MPSLTSRDIKFVCGIILVWIIAAIAIIYVGRWLGSIECKAPCNPAEVAKAISDNRAVLAQLLLAAGTGVTRNWSPRLRHVLAG